MSEVEIEISRELPTRAVWEILLSSHESSREIAISTSDTSFELRDVWKYFAERCVAKGATHNPIAHVLGELTPPYDVVPLS